MKNFFASLLVIFSIFVVSPAVVLAQQEKIDKFDIVYDVQKDGQALVDETIEYDFGLNQKHGIYRDIPLKGYKLENIQVQFDEQSSAYPFEIEREWRKIRIKIGDPNVTVEGVHKYRITYEVDKGVTFFDDFDEMYWNVSGNDWLVPIGSISSKVVLPETVEVRDLRIACYTGVLGSTEKNCSWEVGADMKSVTFEADQSMMPGEGMTVSVGFPKGLITAPTAMDKLLGFVATWWPVVIVQVVFLYALLYWLDNGKDIKIKRPIVTQFDAPKGLSPAEVLRLSNYYATLNEISVTLVELARKGYLQIHEKNKKALWVKSYEYELELIQKNYANDTKLAKFEIFLLSKIFENDKTLVKVSELQKDTKMVTHLQKFYDAVMEEKLIKEEYLVDKPSRVILKWVIFGVVFAVVGFGVLVGLQNLVLGGSLFVSGFVLIIFGMLMPKRTVKGTQAYEHILGLKKYIKTAEKHRLEFQEKENVFFELLPYAMALGLVHKWAKAFDGILTHNPDWYVSDVNGTFSASLFANSIERGFGGVSSAFSSSSSGSGGGGASGGGGGGGGGGSW